MKRDKNTDGREPSFAAGTRPNRTSFRPIQEVPCHGPPLQPCRLPSSDRFESFDGRRSLRPPSRILPTPCGDRKPPWLSRGWHGRPRGSPESRRMPLPPSIIAAAFTRAIARPAIVRHSRRAWKHLRGYLHRGERLAATPSRPSAFPRVLAQEPNASCTSDSPAGPPPKHRRERR